MKSKNMSDYSAMRQIIADMVEEAKQFFNVAQSIQFGHQRLDKQRDFLAKLCSKNHLRLFLF